MKKVFVLLTFCLFCSFTFVSFSKHLLGINRVYHITGAKRIHWDRTSKMRKAKDVDGPLLTMTRTWVAQYANEIETGPNKDRDRQHHWLARSRVKNDNPLFKGHYFMEVMFPYAPANTVMVDPPAGEGNNGKREFQGKIHETLPKPSDARGVVTTTIPYDVNTTIDQCEAWAAIAGGPYDPGNPTPVNITRVSMSSIPWEYESE